MQRPYAVSADRQTWIDVLRGASVLLVILAHAHHFAITAAGADSPAVQGSALLQAVGLLNGLVGPIRMELMFLLSGLFVARGLQKGHTQYLAGKVSNVLYPFLIWALINFALREAGSVFIKGEPLSWHTLFDLLIGAAPPTWFLFDLFACFLVTPLLRRLPAWLVLPLLAALSLLLEHGGHARQADLAYYLAYFYAGDFLVRAGWNPATRWGRGGLVFSALSLVCIGLMVTQLHLKRGWVGYLPFVLASLPLIAMLAQLAARTPLARPLSYAGRNSIVFYLVHFTLFIALAHVIQRATSDARVIFAVLLASGIGLPVLLSLARERRAFAFLDVLFSMRRWMPARRLTDVAPAHAR